MGAAERLMGIHTTCYLVLFFVAVVASLAQVGGLKQTRTVCQNGKHQSPVDLRREKFRVNPNLGIPVVGYRETRARVLSSDGQASDLGGLKRMPLVGGRGALQFRGSKYYPEFVTFHHPSLHTIDGLHDALELQVHHRPRHSTQANMQAADKLVVVKLFDIGKETNESLQTLIGAATGTGPEKQSELGAVVADDDEESGFPVDLQNLIGSLRHFVHYDGSDVAKPCSEGSFYVVDLNHGLVSYRDLSAIRSSDNVFLSSVERMTQSLYGRRLSVPPMSVSDFLSPRHLVDHDQLTRTSETFISVDESAAAVPQAGMDLGIIGVNRVLSGNSLVPESGLRGTAQLASQDLATPPIPVIDAGNLVRLLHGAMNTSATVEEDRQMCNRGFYQSPINLPDHAAPVEFARKVSTSIPVALPNPALEFRYSRADIQMLRLADYNALVIPAPDNRTNEVLYFGKRFTLKYVTLRSPAEHSIQGAQADMEVQLIHASNVAGDILAISVLGKVSPRIENSFLQDALGEGRGVYFHDIIPENPGFYMYDGSLTTPPCREGTKWLVMRESVLLSAKNLVALYKAMGRTNPRPQQELNGRIVDAPISQPTTNHVLKPTDRTCHVHRHCCHMPPRCPVRHQHCCPALETL